MLAREDRHKLASASNTLVIAVNQLLNWASGLFQGKSPTSIIVEAIHKIKMQKHKCRVAVATAAGV